MARASKQKETVETLISEVVLRFLEGENEGVEIRVNPPRELTIGRSEDCDIFLGEKKISRRHCKLLAKPDRVRLKDLQSTNGTFVNKRKVIEAELESDDTVQVGTTVIKVSIYYQKEVSMPEVPAQEQDLDLSSLEEVPDVSGSKEKPPEVATLETEMAQDIEEPLESEKVEEDKSRALSGNLSAMGLADLLQNLSQNQKSGVLQLRSKREGEIIVVDGKIVSAQVGQARGQKALYRMLSWNEGEFELAPLPDSFDPNSVEDPITDTVETLLMEGFRQFDELEKIRKSLPTTETKLRLKPKFKAPLSKLHPRVLDVLQLVINEGTLETVLDLSPYSDLETSKIVFYLLKKEYIVSE